MEAVRRLTARMRVVVPILVLSNGVVKPSSCERFSSAEQPPPSSSSSSSLGSEGKGLGWFAGLAGAGNNRRSNLLPNIVKAGDPVLHQRACEVEPSEMKSERVQKIIDDMISVMRNSPGGVGLAAPQIGIPFRIIVLEDKGEASNVLDSRPFDLLVILNPKLKKKSNRTALFFEGCLSVDGFAAVVERCLDVEVEGFDRYGEPIKISASGWQARILHECDHLDGTLYVDKMVPRTFRTEKNINLPLAHGCPKRAKLGPRA